jgi:hypothetical protein
MVSAILPTVFGPTVFGLFNGSMMKGNLANENDSRSLQKFSVTIDLSIMLRVYTPVFRDSIRRKRAKETSHGQ